VSCRGPNTVEALEKIGVLLEMYNTKLLIVKAHSGFRCCDQSPSSSYVYTSVDTLTSDAAFLVKELPCSDLISVVMVVLFGGMPLWQVLEQATSGGVTKCL
jgi:hypothetical protein